MTNDRLMKALNKATRDLRHANAMAELAFSAAARRRHERRALVAKRRIAEASRWLDLFGCEA